jgi:hypothetical protein
MNVLIAHPIPRLDQDGFGGHDNMGRSSIAVVHAPSRDGSSTTPVGVISRGEGLWRNARLDLNGHGGTVTAHGMPAVIAALADACGGAHPMVVLPLHDGYHALYGPDGAPSHRIMRTPDGWRLRRFSPHASSVHATFDDALAEALKEDR